MIERWVPAASTYAGDIDFLFDLIFWIVAFWFVLSQGAFFYFIFKFKKKDGVKGQYITGEVQSQKKWVTYPHLAVLVFDVVIIVFAVRVWYDVKQHLPEPDYTVRAIAQQWAWTFQHPGPDGELDTADDISKVNELHLEVGKNYHYKLESKDVLHNFSIPVFRLKQDAIPGRVITGWFQPTQTGEYDVQCAEICGIGHGLMGARVFLETTEEHAAWVAENSPLSIAAASPAVAAPRGVEE